MSHAYKFVHESIKEQYSLDVDRYEQIFKGAAYDGLLGCASRTVHKSNFAPDFTARFAHRSWKVTALSPSPIDDDRTVASMTVLPKPVFAPTITVVSTDNHCAIKKTGDQS